jgi:hypothetical protein
LHGHFTILIILVGVLVIFIFILLVNYRLLLPSLGSRRRPTIRLLHDLFERLKTVRLSLDMLNRDPSLLADFWVVATVWDVSFLDGTPCGPDAAFAR